MITGEPPARVITPMRRWDGARLARHAVAPSGRRLVRWWVAAGLAWWVGALGGVSPSAFLGDPAPGLLAAALLGAAAVSYLSPVLILGVMATVVADDDRYGLAAPLHVAGIDAPTRLVGRGLACARTSLALIGVGLVGGMAAAVGLAVRSPDGLTWGIRSSPSPAGLVTAAAIVVASWIVAVLVATAAVTPTRAVVVLAVAFSVTGVVASFVYFVPAMRPVLWCMPAAAVWPFDAESFNSAQFAVSVPAGARLGSGAAWTVVLALFALRRLVTQPYPSTGEPERGRRRPRG